MIEARPEAARTSAKRYGERLLRMLPDPFHRRATVSARRALTKASPQPEETVMLAYCHAKTMAKAMRQALAARDLTISHSEDLGIVARQLTGQ
ncbi:hypothetical protein NKI12_20660 [Mesorhizobium australicum]|jgi:hypothetical protein|uniref:Uncharacterized protein n=1 Tax=Mesorhizobium australicum TaxID=536018 RepID=A0ACC6T2D7_9HYPH